MPLTSHRCLPLFVLLLVALVSVSHRPAPRFWAYSVSPGKATIRTFYKNARGERIDNLPALQRHIESSGKRMLFAMNCGMYSTSYAPVGLYIEEGKQVSALRRCNTSKANFCLQPQGVFYVRRDGKAGISTVPSFSPDGVR